MVTAKGISSMYAPLAAVTVSDEVNEPFAEGGAAFVHGFTNGGHPVASAAGLAVIDVLEEDGLIENSADVGAYLHSQRDVLLAHPTIADVRGAGLMMVPEVVSNKETMEFFPWDAHAERKLQSTALRNGLAFHTTLYRARRPEGHKRGLPMFIAPPLCITREQVDDMMERLDTTLTEWERDLGIG